MVLFDLINFAQNKPDNNTLRDIKILHESLADQCPKIHKERLNSLMVATESLLDGNQLSLTQLGRNIQGKVRAKHSIKRIDRLLGNPPLEPIDSILIAGMQPMRRESHAYRAS